MFDISFHFYIFNMTKIKLLSLMTNRILMNNYVNKRHEKSNLANEVWRKQFYGGARKNGGNF